MQSILSIQSHVVYGYVGNKAITYPLQSLGYDVLPINTVQFSNHTCYSKYQGNIFNPDDIYKLSQGLLDLNIINDCQAILTGYLGKFEIGQKILEIVDEWKQKKSNLIYLCDPVIDNRNCHIDAKLKNFFKNSIKKADIITPNQYEAEILSNMKISNIDDLKKAANYFHSLGVKIVVIKGIYFENNSNLHIFASTKNQKILINQIQSFNKQINGTGDLFSALFLGFYLSNKNLILSLQCVTYFIQLVIQNTLENKKKELQVLSVDYRQIPKFFPYKVEII